ncbi:glucosamine-6-phosphate deaminase [Leuconostoc rapi]|uniref:glucosamine-6-phosphate deaminase n=1 Tax=Leuconostoc rapi TaxID=1406906 RepID=UPI00195E4992|nr:glucosamine-6-phosphate deaminase [Leuconostoc rapi]MBM7436249.1 glucosamine-6-phosphate deaminase [Leuconostoc rapi]
MKIIKVKNPIEGAQKAFDIYQAALSNGTKVLGLATGSTPIALYDKLTESTLDFSNVTSINLDEYLGLAGDDEQSYRYFMNQHLFNQRPFKKSYVPNGISDDHQAAAAQYDKIISENPIDLQLLGIGRNGHIGFNEPGTSFESTTHIVDLTQSTIDANARFFDNPSDVPTQAISMGIASVMSAKEILLMAYGVDKADVIAATVNGPVTEKVPASVLQKHDNVTIIIDEAAATKL